MAKPFKGKIALDIRDSEPDWAPYLRAEGARRRAERAGASPGTTSATARWTASAARSKTPNMTRIADMGVRFSNFHTTALCSPTRASLLTGRNATSNGMATIAEFSSGFPGISTRIPFENGFISEVLRERGYNTYCVGKWHLTPGEECNLAAYKGRWPLGRGFERFYGFLGGETNYWYPGPRPRQPPDRPAGHARGRLPPRRRTSPTRRSSSSGTPRSSTPDKPFFMYLAPEARPRAAPRASRSGPTSTRACSTRATRRSAPGSSRARRSSACCPRTPSCRRSTPTASPSAPARTASRGRCSTPSARGTRSSDDEQRLFARMAEVFAGYVSYTDDQLGRVLDYLEESGELDNTIIVVVSDNGASGEGGPNGTLQRVAVLQRRARHRPSRRCRTSTSSARPTSYNHYNTGWAWAFDTPFPYWKRWAGYEGGVADMCLVAWPAKIDAPERRPPAVHPRGRRRPDHLRPARHRAARGDQGLPAEPDRGRELRALRSPTPTRPGRQTQFYAMLGQRSIYHEGWLACTVHPPLSGLGQLRARRVGAVRPRARPLAVDEPRRRANPSGSRRSKSLWFYYAGIYNGLPLDDRTALEQVLAERPQRQPRPRPVHLLPRLRRRARVSPASLISGRSYTIAAGVDVDSADAEGVLWAARRRRRRPQPLRQGRAAALHVQLGRHRPPGRRRRPARSRRARTCCTRRVRRRRAAAPTRRCPAPPAR